MLGIILGGIILFVGETAGEYFIKPHHEVDFWAGFWIGVPFLVQEVWSLI